MCGIAGHVFFDNAPIPHHVVDMVHRIRHRGPDDSGHWVSPGRECVLGHARLSVIDLSPLAHQPMIDAETGNAIVFNGEIYNFKLLRIQCEAAGDVFNSHSDTEVLLKLYRRHGVNCLKFLRGMFAVAIWDDKRRQIVLARDRIGKKPLNYAVTKAGLLFCSELYPLSQHPVVDNTLDVEALELYLQCQFVPSPWTIYSGIRKLPPAHYAIYDHSGLTLKQYWQIDYRDTIELREADALDALEEKLLDAVRLRMTADVPVGALLSGGVDSSLVVALMAKVSNQPVNTFSIGFEEEAFNELPWAKQAAEICRTAHRPELLKGNVEHLLPILATHYGEPFADHSALPAFSVSAAARRHVTVVLNGDGGDELLGGYSQFALSNWVVRLSERLGGLVPRGLLAVWLSQNINVNRIPQRIIRKLFTQYTNPEVRSLMYGLFWSDSERKHLFPDGPNWCLGVWRQRWLDGAFNHARNPVDRMLWVNYHTYLPDALLVKMDIASMHCGLETRSPLLDHELVEFCARLPVRYKVNNGVGKYLLKRLAERYFPAPFVYRRKMGFGIPLADWLRGPLRRVLRDTLLDAELMAPLAGAVIEKTLQEFETGRTDHSSRLWALLMFGIWRSHQRVS